MDTWGYYLLLFLRQTLSLYNHLAFPNVYLTASLGCQPVNFNSTRKQLNSLSAAAAAKSLQSCTTQFDPIDSSPPGPAIPGILQARTLEWVAISSSNAWKWKVKVKSLSHVRLLSTPYFSSCIPISVNCTDMHMRRQWDPTPVLLPGKSHGWRSLVGCSPWGC